MVTFSGYKRAFELARLIILNYSPDINKGNENMIALLFDMNQLWEEYVFVMLRKEVNKEDSPYQNFTVHPKAKKRFWNHNYPQPVTASFSKSNKLFSILQPKSSPQQHKHHLSVPDFLSSY